MGTRAVRDQLLNVVLMCLGILVSLLPVYGRKNENNPDKVGHRNVARKTSISPENERAIGKQESEQFERSAEIIQDPVVEQYLTTVARNVVTHSDWKHPVAVKVLRSPHVNGSSFPGGYIYLSSELILAAQNDDEIAAVIAHQVAHAAARHWAEEMDRMLRMQLTINLANVTTANGAAIAELLRDYGNAKGDNGAVVCVGYVEHGRMGMPVAFLMHQRQNELEADYLGLQYVYKAGYAPSAYVGLLRDLKVSDTSSQGQPDSLRGTPLISERIAQAEKEIGEILPNAPQPKSSPEFVLMKSRF
jgi:predicted Zn-dependent protease